MRKLPFVLALALAACGGGDDANTIDAASHPDSPRTADAHPDSPRAIDAAVDAASVDKTVALSGGANGLVWDAPSSTLFLTDNNADELDKYTDAGGLAEVVALPTTTSAKGISLGSLVERSDGSILIASFGFGTDGSIFEVASGLASSTKLTGLDATRRRIGLAQDSNGLLYTAYFTGASGQPQVGGVASVAVAGTVATETEIATATTGASPVNFGKLVGLVATPTALFVTDQTAKAIYKITIPAHDVSVLATVPTADQLFMLPNGDLLTGGGSAISRVTQAGVVTTLANTGFTDAEGLALDPALHRLFIVDHSSTAGTPDHLVIQAFTP